LCTFGRSWWGFVHIWKFLVGFCAFLEFLHMIFCIFGRNSQNVFEILHRIFWKFFMDFLHFWKFLMGLCEFWKFLMRFCALLEVPSEIFCIYGSSSWDFVHYSKSIMGFCAFSEDRRGILCII
jgi:hypothetical protein